MDDAIGDIGTWHRWASPEDAGWSAPHLAQARDHAAGIGSAAVMIASAGRVVAAWGEVARKFNVHSIRKSLLSALIGIAARRTARSRRSTRPWAGCMLWSSTAAQPQRMRWC